jgi:hypothetical protein
MKRIPVQIAISMELLARNAIEINKVETMIIYDK